MKTKELIQNIKGVFKLPVKKYYFGKLRYGNPYFYPMHFSPTILKIRKVTKKSDEEISKLTEYGRKRLSNLYNLPMVLRNKFWVIKLFKNYYWIEIGWPFKISTTKLGWKDKWETPRFEWCPSFQIYFFGLQFCIWWKSPDGDDDSYYEQILWYLEYSNKDIINAANTWSWKDMSTEKSTWKDEYVINYLK